MNGFTELLVGRLGIARGLPVPGYPEGKANDDARYSWRIDAPVDGIYEVAIWYESSPAAAESATYVVEHADGSVATTLDQRAWGARWIKLGDVRLARGAGIVTVSNAGNGQLEPGRLRVTQWPRQAVADSGKTPAH